MHYVLYGLLAFMILVFGAFIVAAEYQIWWRKQ